MTYPDRRPASTSVPYNQVTKMRIALRLVGVPGSNPRTMSSARWSENIRIEIKDATVRSWLCFIGHSLH